MSQNYLDVTVKKNDIVKFQELIDISEFYYDSFNNEFASFSFPVEDENDANNLERELDMFLDKHNISVSYEYIE